MYNIKNYKCNCTCLSRANVCLSMVISLPSRPPNRSDRSWASILWYVMARTPLISNGVMWK